MSKIVEINGKYYDFGTQNSSFLTTAAELKALGVKNYYFMLEVKNPRTGVQDTDPFASNLTRAQIETMMIEAHQNVWYFCREISRIPIQGGLSVPYTLHRGLAATIWLFTQGYDSCLCIPRQCYKTSETLAGPLNWAYLVGTSNSRFHFFGKDSKNTKENLTNMKEYQKVLPKWIQMKEALDDKGKIKRGRMNQESITNAIMNNRITISAEPRSLEHAQSLARGLSVPFFYFDELEFTPFIDTIVSNSAPAYRTAADNARKNNAPAARFCTSTPGDLDTKPGKAGNALIQSMVKWTEKLYDKTKEEIDEYIEASVSEYNENSKSDKTGLKIFYVEYQWNQIRKTKEWLKEITATMGSRMDVRREIFLQRLRGSSESPIDQEVLEYLISNMQKSTKDILLINKYRMICYPHGQSFPDTNLFDKNIPYLVGIDPAEGGGGDNTAITVVNPFNLQVAAEFKSPYIGLTDQFRLIMDLVINYIPKAVLIPERNMGMGLIELILESKIRNRLYFHKNDNIIAEVSEETPEDDKLRSLSQEKKKYGTRVHAQTRKIFFEILMRYVTEYKNIINTEYLVDDICKLIVKKTQAGSRIQAVDGEHDDCVFSWMHCMFIYEYGDNLEFFGIHVDKHSHPISGDFELEIDEPEIDTEIYDADDVSFERIFRESAMQIESLGREMVSKNVGIYSEDFQPYKEDDEVNIPSYFFDQMNI